MEMTAPSQTQLLGLYLAQGAPGGFQSTLVPLLFRQWNKSYRVNAVVQLSYLPWVLKPLVAPYFEQADMSSVSKALLFVGLVQIMIYLTVTQKDSERLVCLLLVANVTTALYDIFVDKLAIQQRSMSELDFANVFQVVGYKLGLMLTGGCVLFLTSHHYIRGIDAFTLSPLVSATVLLGMSAWLYLTSKSAITHTSNPRTTGGTTTTTTNTRRAKLSTFTTFFDSYRLIYSHFKSHMLLYAMLFTYKAGESTGDSLFKPFLRDSGFDLKTLSSMSLINEVVSILGSLTMIKTSKQSRKTNTDLSQLRMYLVLNIIPQCLRALVVCNSQLQHFVPVALITLIEHFIGGAVTVACFNFMFSSVIPRVEGTHYAVYSSIEVLGKICASFCANYAVESVGFTHTFLAAVALSVLPVVLCGMSGGGDSNSGDSINNSKDADKAD